MEFDSAEDPFSQVAPSQVYSPPTFEDNLSFPSENPPASSSQIDPEEQERLNKKIGTCVSNIQKIQLLIVLLIFYIL